MILTKKKQHRLCIYVFFDAQGKADRYVKYFLEKLQDVVDDTIVVVNGKITDESKEYIRPYVKDILVRENKGYDISAYKHGLQSVGYDKLKEYDEVIVCNDTMFGPVYPFSEMFDAMSSRDLDFWGITRHGKLDENVFESKYGYMPEHIQSYFITFRQSLVQSDYFKEYWETLPLITDRDSAIGTFETLFTKHFEDLGFKWDTYVGIDKFVGIKAVNPCFNNADIIVKHDRCPLFKKKLFLLDHEFFYEKHIHTSVSNLYDYMLTTGVYDVSMIWENILRISPQSDYFKNLQLNYAVSARRLEGTKPTDYRCAVVLRVVHAHKMRTVFDVLSRFGSKFDIYIITDLSKELLATNEEYHLRITKIIESSRSLGYVYGEYLSDYDIVCSIDATHTLNREFYKLDDVVSNIAGSDIQVNNILNLFCRESNLGMLCYSDSATILNQLKSYKKDYTIFQSKCKDLGLNIPVKKGKCHIMPQADCMWFRVDAFSKLAQFDDGISLDYYSLIAQDAGYFTAYIRSDSMLESDTIVDIHKMTKDVYRPGFFARIKNLISKCLGFWRMYGFVKFIKKVFRVLKRKLFSRVKKEEID